MTFGVRSAASTLSNFPKFQQSGDTMLGNGTATIAQKGALLTAVASILRYHQNRGELGSPNGPADPASLNQFLTAYCPADAKGKQICDGFLSNPDSGEQIVNLWRAAEFTGGADVEVDAATPAAIADLVAQGSPVLLSLALSLNGAPVGGHFVVATGIASDGSVVIQDPNPFFARTSLDDYLTGFSAAGGTWKADSARRRALCAAQSAVDALPGGGALAACRADADAFHRRSTSAAGAAARRSSCWIAWMPRARLRLPVHWFRG